MRLDQLLETHLDDPGFSCHPVEAHSFPNQYLINIDCRLHTYKLIYSYIYFKVIYTYK